MSVAHDRYSTGGALMPSGRTRGRDGAFARRSRAGVTRRELRARGTPPVASERPLRIALLAPPWLPVPPSGYGGIESVVALLAEVLVARGHDVELFAAPGSRSAAKLVPLLDRAHAREIGTSIVEADHVARAFDHIDRAAVRDRPFDVVHDHSGWVALAMADRLATPMLHTVHGPFEARAARFYAAHGHKAALSCLTNAQAAARPHGVSVAAVVPNPIDADAWSTDVAKEDYVLWAGRFTPEKGAHRAIRAAQRSGLPLRLAGPVQPGQERFFAEAIEPHLDGERIRYVGEVGGAHKRRLFAAARALLMPIRWREPFGMVMIEAMAAGTPVIAFAQGSAPEIVEVGRSGLLVGDEDAMVDALRRLDLFDPDQCRASARERFSPTSVAERYERVYRAIATPAPARRVPASPPAEALTA
jgi:glycosyltransferase involved in cell wall biosynthesis